MYKLPTSYSGNLNGQPVVASVLLYRGRVDPQTGIKRWGVRLEYPKTAEKFDLYPCPYEALPEGTSYDKAERFITEKLGLSKGVNAGLG